jgi:tripartite-type tricarboxylate transporter receptor subunit TctC
MKCIVPTVVALTLFAGAAHAQNYPNKPIRVIAAQSAGSSLDTIARIATAKMSEQLGQQMVIDNRGGAGGIVAVELVSRAPADGYTLLVGAPSSMIIATFTYRNLPFDAVKDFEPISLLVNAEGVLAVNPSVTAKSVKELIALAKAQPGKLNMASAGIGSSSHLAGIMFTSLAGIDTVHVPYKGGGPMAAAVVGGEAQWVIAPAASLVGQIKGGRLRALGLTSKTRSPLMPDLPTIEEAGVPGYEYTSWNALFAPKGTPRAIVRTLFATVTKVLADPDLKQQYANQGLAPLGSESPEEFGRFFRADYDRVARLVKLAGIKPE